MKWIFLMGSILFEVAGTTALKLASKGGPNMILFGALVVVAYLICFGLLGYTMKFFEIGTIYAIWSGLGVALLAAIGVIFFGDSLNGLKILSLVLIIAGIVGLNLSGTSH